VITAHLQLPPEPLSERLGRDLPPELESLVLRCLEKDREARFASASDLERALSLLPEALEWDPETAAAWWGNGTPPSGR